MTAVNSAKAISTKTGLCKVHGAGRGGMEWGEWGGGRAEGERGGGRGERRTQNGHISKSSLLRELPPRIFASLLRRQSQTHDHTICFIVALRPRRRDGLLGTGTEWEGDDSVKARPRKAPEKDRRDRGPPPEQWKC